MYWFWSAFSIGWIIMWVVEWAINGSCDCGMFACAIASGAMSEIHDMKNSK